jgi:hypothetical protein
VAALSRYETKSNGPRTLFKCSACKACFSETKFTFLQNLKTPINKIVTVLNSRTEGMGFNAACRVHHISSHTLQNWEQKFCRLKETLMLFALTKSFLSLIIEGDELYTKVHENKPQEESEGWTVMLLDRGSRFIWELSCGKKEKALFLQAIQRFSDLVEKTDEISLLTDGERRYSNILFEICYELLHTDKPGRPRKVLPEGVQVRVKNKGSQAHKKGPKRAKYQTPKPEHPETKKTITNADTHANHVEAQNATIRRKNSAYRRRTNTYAKSKDALQRTLDVYWVVHNFVRVHYTTKVVPAVKAGIIKQPFTWESIMSVRLVF